MIRGWQIYRGQAPVFHQEIDFTLVAFWLTTEVDQLTNIFTDSSKKGVSGSLKTSEKTGKKIVLSKKQREIVAILTEDYSRSFSEIAEILSIAYYTVQEHFAGNYAISGILFRIYTRLGTLGI